MSIVVQRALLSWLASFCFLVCIQFQINWNSARASCNRLSILAYPFPFLTSRDRWFRSIAVEIFDVVRLSPFHKRVSDYGSLFFAYDSTVLAYLNNLSVIEVLEELGGTYR